MSPFPERIDALFRLPLAEFVRARNALAARLRKEKEVAAADEVKALVKPSVPAWVVNQLYWDYRADFDLLLAAGDRLRADQQRGLQGGRAGELQAAIRERREAQAGLLRCAELVLAGDERPAAPATLKRVETTLEAIAARGGAGDDAQLGRLTRDLDPPGFDALLALTAAAAVVPPPRVSKTATAKKPVTPVSSPAPAASSPKPKAAGGKKAQPVPEAAELSLPRAQAVVAEAVERLERCRFGAAEAEAVRAAAAADARKSVAEVSTAKRRLGRAERQATEANVALKRAEARKQMADEGLEQARDNLALARSAAEKARRGS